MAIDDRLARQLLKYQSPDQHKEDHLDLGQSKFVAHTPSGASEEGEQVAPYARDGVLGGAEVVILPFFDVAGGVEEGGIGPEDVFGDVNVAVRCLSAVFGVLMLRSGKRGECIRTYGC